MDKSIDEWLASPDYYVRLVLLSGDRLREMARQQAPPGLIKYELELLQRRTGDAIIAIENTPQWSPGDKILPE